MILLFFKNGLTTFFISFMYIFWLHKVIASHCCNTIVLRCDDRARGNLINYIQSVRSSSSQQQDNYFECFLILQPCLPQLNTPLLDILSTFATTHNL